MFLDLVCTSLVLSLYDRVLAYICGCRNKLYSLTVVFKTGPEPMQ